MFVGPPLLYGAVLCLRLEGEVLNREWQSAWVQEAIKIMNSGFWYMGGYALCLALHRLCLRGVGVESVVGAALSRCCQDPRRPCAGHGCE